VIVAAEELFREIMRVCGLTMSTLISDEVICGFGRLGTMFGLHRPWLRAASFDNRSQSVHLGLTSRCSRGPCRRRLYQAMLGREPQDRHLRSQGLTYSGHSVRAAVALKGARPSTPASRIAEQAARKAAQQISWRGSPRWPACPLVRGVEARGASGLLFFVGPRSELVWADKATQADRAMQRGRRWSRAQVRFDEDEGVNRGDFHAGGPSRSARPGSSSRRTKIDELFDRYGPAALDTVPWNGPSAKKKKKLL